MSIDELRGQLADVDKEILSLIAKRQELVAQIGQEKIQNDASTRDFSQEKRVFDRARKHAASIGVSEKVADQIMATLIESSLARQESDRISAQGTGSGHRALVIGGLGLIGGWFVRFLSSQGYDVDIADVSVDKPADSFYKRWQDSEHDYQLMIVATPMEVSNDILQELSEHKTEATIFDVGSLKSPLRSGLEALVESGAKVTSLHPMFGPDTEMLSGRHVVCIDLGNAEANTYAQELFGSTMATWVTMSMEEHDRMMSYVLGLSHAINIAFADALATSDEQVQKLAGISSTTFDAQLSVSSAVVQENPDLYYEIQALNEYGIESLSTLLASLERLRSTIKTADRQGFREIMLRGRRYVSARDQKQSG